VPVTIYTPQFPLTFCNETALDVGYALAFTPAPGIPEFVRLTNTVLLTERMRQLSAWDGTAAFRVVQKGQTGKIQWKDRRADADFIVLDSDSDNDDYVPDAGASSADPAPPPAASTEEAQDGAAEGADGAEAGEEGAGAEVGTAAEMKTGAEEGETEAVAEDTNVSGA